MTALLICLGVVGPITLVLGFCALVGANSTVDRATRAVDRARRERDDARQQRDEALNLAAAWRSTAETAANVRPIREAPAFDRIAAVIAHNEAGRADWDAELEQWGRP